MKNAKINLGYDVAMGRGPVLRPTHFQLWNKDTKSSHVPARAPLKYQADALLGFAFMKLNPENTHSSAAECISLWEQIEPHLSLHREAQSRVKAMATHRPSTPSHLIKQFEKSFLNTLQTALTKDAIDFKELTSLIDHIVYLEDDMKTPVLYNFSCPFSPEFTETLQALDSFLFHLRNLVAIDYNNLIEDPSHEALKVDSVTDYLPKGDYVVSDAVLYWQIKKLTKPFVAGTRSDIRIEKLLAQPIESAFKQYAHNACQLIDHLPEHFLKGLGPLEMEDTLYLVQMDWLLGTGTGMLFKIREELYGLQNGYEKIFWPEVENRPYLKPTQLNLHLHFTSNEILGLKKSA